jgi:hypothetical protein
MNLHIYEMLNSYVKLQIFQKKIVRRTNGSERDKRNWEFAVLHSKNKYDLCRSLVFL